jgi:hypothetical protein
MNNVVDDFGNNFSLIPGTYLEKVFTFLEQNLDNYKDYLFIIHDNNDSGNLISEFFDHPKKILISRRGEEKKNNLERIANKFLHVFANYYWNCENVTTIPLGYHSFAEIQNENVNIDERIFDLNFIGALNRNRISFASRLANINPFWITAGLFFQKAKILKWLNHYLLCKRNNDKLQFNYDFNNGVSAEDYTNQLRLSKIALCPKGFYNIECFRIYEAMRYGCVIITEKLPDRKFYQGMPAFQVNNWNDGMQIAEILLKDANLLQVLSNESKQWYENHFSPLATSKIMIEKINRLNG